MASPQGVFFARSTHASEAVVRRALLLDADRAMNMKIFQKDGLGSLGSFLPLPGTVMAEKVNYILGNAVTNKSTEAQLFVAMTSYLCSTNPKGNFTKNGLQYTVVPGEDPNLFRCAIDCINPETGVYERAGTLGIAGPGVNPAANQRQSAIASKLGMVSESFFKAPIEKILGALASTHQLISNNDDVGPGGQLAGDVNYANLCLKSEGNQNLVMTHPSDPKKVIKMVLGSHQDVKTKLEVLTNRVIAGAGFACPKTEIFTDKNTGVQFMMMDNYKVTNDFCEGRQEYFLDMMGKGRNEAHNMNYQSMSKFLDLYELKLPPNLRDPIRLEENKMAIFRWALVNSATNNTDNHGRNLSVMVDEVGRLSVAPFIDISFDQADRPMSTYIDGEPPIHHIDIMDNDQLRALWEELDIDASFALATGIRDSLVKSLGNIPDYAVKMGINLFDAPMMDHIVKSSSIQSAQVGRMIAQSIESAQNRQLEQQMSRSTASPEA